VDRTILFICTGNYYRSRFAEALFNHHAELRELNWRAISRGLVIKRVIEVNKLSPFTFAAMLQRGIKRQHTSVDPNSLTSLDLINADLAIAMYEAEHRPMMMEKYPLWVDHVIYWRVPDLLDSQPSEAISEIERQVFRLLNSISASNPIDTSAPINTDQCRLAHRRAFPVAMNHRFIVRQTPSQAPEP
jgi:protein-tyrosine phosphatase